MSGHSGSDEAGTGYVAAMLQCHSCRLFTPPPHAFCCSPITILLATPKLHGVCSFEEAYTCSAVLAYESILGMASHYCGRIKGPLNGVHAPNPELSLEKTHRTLEFSDFATSNNVLQYTTAAHRPLSISNTHFAMWGHHWRLPN